MSENQIAQVSSSLTSTANGVLDTFISLLPIIALTTGVIFAIRFVKGRFKKVERIR